MVTGELRKHQLGVFYIRKGNYIYIDVKNFRENMPAIYQAFEKILKDHPIDPKGSLLEWYLNENDCRCIS